MGRGGSSYARRFPDIQTAPTSTLAYSQSYSLTSTSDVAEQDIKWSEIGADTSHVWKLTSVDFEIVSPPGTTSPTRFQVELNAASGQTEYVSRVFAVGGSPIRFKARMPKSSDWSGILSGANAVLMRYRGVVVVNVVIHYVKKAANELV